MFNYLNKLLSKLRLHKLEHEVFEAYFHKLPSNIQVSWFRDGKFIVGRVKAGEKEFMTQGHDVEEFVDMVNDAVITVYGVPEDYIDSLRSAKTYIPDPEQKKALTFG